MAVYRIKVMRDSNGEVVGEQQRQRRDAAALAFERAVFDRVEGYALRDRWRGNRALQEACEAYKKTCFDKYVTVGDYTIRFWKDWRLDTV